jgi:hypothetical protein
LFFPLKVKSYLTGDGTRAYIVRPAKGGEKIIERVIVCEIGECQLRAPSVLVSLEKIVDSQRQVEEVA